MLQSALMPPKAGMDELAVAYTESAGPCKAIAAKDVEDYRGDGYGTRHKRLAGRVCRKGCQETWPSRN